MYMDSLITSPGGLIDNPDIPSGQLIKKLLMISGVLAVFAYALYLRFRRWQLTLQAQMQRSESINRLLDRFGNAKEFLDFLQTEPGERLLEDQLAHSNTPLARMIQLVQWGTVLLVVGVIFLAVMPGETALGLGRLLGVFVTSIGAGLLVAALVTFLMARKWDVRPGSSKSGGGPRA
jgi:hypothetical protein